MHAVLLAPLASILVLVAGLSPAPAPTADWTTVDTQAGFGLLQTDPFEIGAPQWRVTVSTTQTTPAGQNPLILVAVYRQGDDEAPVQTLQTQIPGTYAEELDAGPGQYYLDVT